MAKLGLRVLCTLFVLAATLSPARSQPHDVMTLESLVTLVQQQAVALQALQAKVTSLDQQLKVSKADLESEVKAMGGELEAYKDHIETEVEAGQATLQERVEGLHANVSHLASRLDTTVYFNAHVDQSGVSVGDASPIKFDAVTGNVGGGYDPATGLFSAPVSGVYVLHVQLMRQRDSDVWYAIDKAGVWLCANEVYGDTADKSSCQATAHLQKGERVSVRRTSGGHLIQGGWYCAFSGFLLSLDP